MNLNEFDDYQNEVAKSVQDNHLGDKRLPVLLIGMVGELGELYNVIKKHYSFGRGLSRSMLEEELGDVLWHLSEMCRAYGFTLSEIAEKNLIKIMERYPDAFKG